ncbi:MAG: hypothetical protein VW378_03050 [bacterium]
MIVNLYNRSSKNTQTCVATPCTASIFGLKGSNPVFLVPLHAVARYHDAFSEHTTLPVADFLADPDALVLQGPSSNTRYSQIPVSKIVSTGLRLLQEDSRCQQTDWDWAILQLPPDQDLSWLPTVSIQVHDTSFMCHPSLSLPMANPSAYDPQASLNMSILPPSPSQSPSGTVFSNNMTFSTDNSLPIPSIIRAIDHLRSLPPAPPNAAIPWADYRFLAMTFTAVTLEDYFAAASALSIMQRFLHFYSTPSLKDLKQATPSVFCPYLGFDLSDNGAAIIQAYKRAFPHCESGYADQQLKKVHHEPSDICCTKLLHTLIRFLQSLRTQRALEVDLKKEVNIGSEFTFCCQQTYHKELNPTSSWPIPLMTAWRQMIDNLPLGPDISWSFSKDPHSSNYAIRITYTHNPSNETWWWRLDADDGCLETQTQPSSFDQLRRPWIQTIIKQHIFQAAEACSYHLIPDQSKRGGGGHLSLDATSLFHGSATLLLETFRYLHAHRKEWNAFFQSDPSDARLNAPWLIQLKLPPNSTSNTTYPHAHAYFEQKSAQWLRDIDNGHLHYGKSVPGLVSDCCQELTAMFSRFQNPCAQQLCHSTEPRLRTQGKNYTTNPEHYLAVTAEHLSEDRMSRIEFRAIPAQRNLDEFFQHIEKLFDFLVRVRSRVENKFSSTTPSSASVPQETTS